MTDTIVIAPPRFRDRTLDGYRAETTSARKALDAARRLVAGEIRNLVLAGPTGVGKTHLAAGIVNAVAVRQLGQYEAAKAAADLGGGSYWPRVPEVCEWLNVADTIVRLRIEMDRPPDDRYASAELARMARAKGLVVLDDLGREKISDWTGEIVYALVNARYESMLPTIVTTNLASAELSESPYWPAISRLAEDGLLVRIDAPDRRLAAR